MTHRDEMRLEILIPKNVSTIRGWYTKCLAIDLDIGIHPQTKSVHSLYGLKLDVEMNRMIGSRAFEIKSQAEGRK